jgi:solute:Na+ symporter, SSS family
VQRYLTAKSVDEARTSLLMSAYWKIPLQALVLLVGVFLFLFYLFTPAPMLFNRVHDRRCARASAGRRVLALEQRFGAADRARGVAARPGARRAGRRGLARRGAREAFREREADVRAARNEAVALVREDDRRPRATTTSTTSSRRSSPRTCRSGSWGC